MLFKRSQSNDMSFLNSAINKLGVEMHIPGYQYCGPGTHLKKRLERGDPGINPLDKACREHDIAYNQYKDLKDRHRADKVLASRAWQRVTAKDSSIGERLASLAVAKLMKSKVQFGLGLKKRKMKTKKFPTYVKEIMGAIKRSPSTNANKISNAVRIANKLKTNNIRLPTSGRIITLKKGGFLPFLIPLFAGLSAIGSLAGGASAIASAVNKSKAAKEQLDEAKRHNMTMEQVQVGKGLYLKPYKSGCGLYLRPYDSCAGRGLGGKKKNFFRSRKGH